MYAQLPQTPCTQAKLFVIFSYSHKLWGRDCSTMWPLSVPWAGPGPKWRLPSTTIPPPVDYLIVIHVYSDINQLPSLASCYVLASEQVVFLTWLSMESNFLDLLAFIHILPMSICPTPSCTLYNSLVTDKWHGNPFCLVASKDMPFM